MYRLSILLCAYNLTSNYNHTPFSQHQVHDSFKAYSRVVVQLIAFVIHASSHSTYQCGWHDSISTLMQSFATEIRNEDVAEHVDFDEYVKNIILSLWTETWPVSHDNPFPDPTICFIIHTQINQDGTIKEPCEVTGILAKLTYLMVCGCRFYSYCLLT